MVVTAMVIVEQRLETQCIRFITFNVEYLRAIAVKTQVSVTAEIVSLNVR
ncbi:hypothetical protein E2C01_061479 [Portunus trituberculatus]|uniref:Uncharacterized protein n=1 Tax=Portunus trituberculatus TaxID=210409 RepID=A0A5B7HDA9_PORTR|nr:hypothetical protein [Portunus trituberculatus]